MNIKPLLGLLVGAISFVLVGCEKFWWDDCLRGRGDRYEERRGLIPIKGLDFELAADLYITYDTSISTPVLNISAQQNIIDEIETEVSNSILSIRFKNCVQSHDPITFFLRTPYLDDIVVSGPGEIFSENALFADTIKVFNTGTGQAELTVNTYKVITQLSGSGNVQLSGRCSTAVHELSAAGNLNARVMECDTAFVNVLNSGNATLFVADSLIARISGSGSIFYTGTPGILNQTGSNNIINNN